MHRFCFILDEAWIVTYSLTERESACRVSRSPDRPREYQLRNVDSQCLLSILSPLVFWPCMQDPPMWNWHIRPRWHPHFRESEVVHRAAARAVS